jgi:hypothetical protein
MHTLRFGYFLTDTTHDGSGTVENIRGSHRTMHNAYSQTSLLFKPVTTNSSMKDPHILTEGDLGTDESRYSADHHVIKAPAGTIFCFQNGCWHRALPNVSPHPRTIVYFQYCQTMLHPLHRPTPYEGDLSRYTAEERWLLHEQKSAPTGWVYGDAKDKVRMDRFRRDGEGADYYQKALEAELAKVSE